jgi:hypothetical protein
MLLERGVNQLTCAFLAIRLDIDRNNRRDVESPRENGGMRQRARYIGR